ncbi:MAG: orotate phosphoribosyltransferase, partial [Candidatus Eremiobacteraeota bacterium]|nr:orotate phosphoribosyltransferase [Candidatus Eremiobacteraeota bacterium]
TFRKEAKAHGEGGMFLGHHLSAQDRIVLVDDVMTSGQTKFDALEMVRTEAARLGLEPPRFEAVVVGVDRQEAEGAVTAAQAFTAETGLPVFAVATIRELADELEGDISPAHHRALREYLER